MHRRVVNEAFDYFAETYGLDFRNGLHDPVSDTYYLLPNALMIQITRMGDPSVPVNFDSANQDRIGEWFGYEVGVLVLMTSSGTFPGGLCHGLPYFAGDVLSKNTYNFVAPGRDWSSPKYREDVKGFLDWPPRQSTNSFVVSDTFGQIRIVDKKGHTGYLVSVVDRVIDLNGNWI